MVQLFLNFLIGFLVTVLRNVFNLLLVQGTASFTVSKCLWNLQLKWSLWWLWVLDLLHLVVQGLFPDLVLKLLLTQAYLHYFILLFIDFLLKKTSLVLNLTELIKNVWVDWVRHGLLLGEIRNQGIAECTSRVVHSFGSRWRCHELFQIRLTKLLKFIQHCK